MPSNVSGRRERTLKIVAVVLSAVGILSACGIGPGIYTPPPPPPIEHVALSARWLEFEAPIGAASGKQLTVTNTTAEAVFLRTPRILGGGKALSLQSTCPPQLAPQQTCTLSVTFSPGQKNRIFATLLVEEAGGASYLVRLQGFAIENPPP